MRGAAFRLSVAAAVVGSVAACGLSAIGSGEAVAVLPDAAVDASSVPVGEASTSPIPEADGAVADASVADASTDAAIDDGASDADLVDAPIDAPAEVIAFVQSGNAAAIGQTTFPVSIAATKAGNFLAVLVSQDWNTTATVTGIADNATGARTRTRPRTSDRSARRARRPPRSGIRAPFIPAPRR